MAHHASIIETIARAVIIEHHHVLLCRHAKKRYVYLPGGHVEFGESASTALARELIEEAGVKIRVGACLLVEEHAFTQGKKSRHELNLIFEASRVRKSAASGTPAPVASLEAGIEFVWWPLGELAKCPLVPPSHLAWLKIFSGTSRRTSNLEFRSEIHK